MKKKTYILTFLMMLCSFAFGQATYHWDNPNGWQQNMVIYGNVTINGEAPDSNLDLELGAFCGNELRGREKVSRINDNKEFIVYGAQGHAITFKLYDCTNNSMLDEYECSAKVTFQEGEFVVGKTFNFTSKNHWNPAHNTNSNMTVTAKVTINGANVNGDYEIGAFIGETVCGSARVNNSIAYIVISANVDDRGNLIDANGQTINENNVTFKLWNHKSNLLANEITDVTVNYEHNATYGSQENPFVINFNEAVAEVAGEDFATLQAAVNATTATNTEVKVLRDFALDNTVTIANNQTVVLNLNGKTISQVKACTASYSMINNKGNLTINGEGKLSFKDTGAGDSNFGWGSYTISNTGSLVVENGTIEHLGTQTFGTHCIMAIYQYSGSTTINGGTISTPNYRSARLWKGNMTINGGTFDGQVWVQAVDNSANLKINGGTFEPNGGDASAVFVTNNQYKVELNVTAGTFNGKIGTSDANKEGVKGSISGGTFSATAKEGTNVALLQEGYVFKQNTDGTYGVVPGLNGSGTEEDPFIIMDMVDLTFFRNHVNSGGTIYNAPGKWVALGADIDMTGVNWVGIGSATADHGFMGNFDGKIYKIQNLTITNPDLDSDGYAYAGLFAVTEGTENNQNTIKNLTIENVTITTTGHIVSAVIAYPYYTIVDNVKVCGDIAITGGDYTAGVLAYTRRCVNASNLSIVGEDGSFIKGNQTVGGVISDIQMNGGLTAVYNNFSAEGLTITGTKSVGGISGIISRQTLNGATVKNVTLNCSDARVGVVSGSMGATSTISTVVAENVTGATAIIGATYDNAKAIEAKIGDTYYATLEDALAAANENDIITLLVPYTVEAGETLTIDKKVTYSSDVLGEAMITNKGTLTITGSVDYTYTGQPDATYSKGNYTINNSGTLTVNGNVENKTKEMSHASYAINTNAGATLNVESGNVLNLNGHAIRMVSFGTAENNVNINGGYIEGTRALQVQLPSGSTSTAKPEMNLAISGGELKSNEETYNLAVYVYSNGQSAENLNINITGGTFSGNVAINDNATNTMKPGSVNVQGGTFNGQWGVYSYANDTNNTIAITGGAFKTNYSEKYSENDGYIFEFNGTYYIVKEGTYVARNITTGQGYVKLQDAVDAAEAGDTIELLQDITLVGGYENDTEAGLGIEKDLTINGGNHTINCGDFIKGIRIYNNKTIEDPDNTDVNHMTTVNIKDVTVINEVKDGRCIDTRSGNIDLKIEGVTLSATNGNSQPLTIGGDYPVRHVVIKNSTIDAGYSGYGVISFVSTIGYIQCSGTNVSGYAAFYLKGDGKTNLQLSGGTYIGENIHSGESNNFGTIVAEGDGNNVTVNMSNPIVKAIATGNAAQAAFMALGSETVINLNSGSYEVITQGENAYWAMIDAEVAESTKIIDNSTNNNIRLYPAAEADGFQFMTLEEAVRYAKAESTVTVVNANTVAKPIIVKKDLTLNLNGKAITAAENVYPVIRIQNDANVTVTDLSEGANGSITNGDYVFVLGEKDPTETTSAGNLTIEGGKYVGETTVAQVTKGNLVINGGEFSIVEFENYDYAYVINCYDASYNAEPRLANVSIKGGTFHNWNPENNAAEGAGTDFCAEGYFAVEASENVYEVVEGLIGKGTEAEPFLIRNLKELKFFRDHVNAGKTKYNTEDVYVALAANIDMATEDWSVNIGDDCNYTFDGIFDGKNHTISNLNSTETAPKADGYICTGLFGAIYGNAVVKNLTIENVNIEAEYTGNNVAAVVGFVYNGIGSIENVTVKNVKIDAPNAYGVGAIVGYSYSSNNFTINGCKVNDAEIAAGSGAGAVIGYCGNSNVIGCTVDDVTIEATGLVGGVAGIALAQTVVENNAVKNATLTTTGEFWVNSAAIAVGTMAGNGLTVANTTFENVSASKMVGSVYAEHPTTAVPAVQARIGNVYYGTFDAALAAAQTGNTITVISPVVVAKDAAYDMTGITVAGENVYPIFRIQNGATMTVENANITNATDYVFVLGASDSSSFGNLTIEGGKYHGATSVASVTCGTLTVNGGEFSVEPYQGSYAYLINCIDANYSNQTAKVVVKGGIFHNWNPENNAAEGEGTNFCDASYYALEVETGLFFVLPKTEIKQSTSLDAGWNWFSLYVDLSGEEGLGTLRNSLTDGLSIKNQDEFTNYDVAAQIWYGSLLGVKVNDMYMIQVDEAQTINLNAYQVNPADYEFTLNTNWTWIGYPSMYALPISTALNGFTPTVGDRIKSQDAFAEYTENDGWQGSLMIMEPGEGFMYFNKSGEKTLVYSATNGYRGEAPAANITAANNLMVPNMSKYANNMNITAVVNIDGEELMTEDFEVAVFAGEELRGSARPIYIESLNRYMLFITVYGEESEELTFKYYDLNSGEELDLFADSKVVFEINSIVGSVEQPSVLSYGTLSIDETSASSFNIYPNPTTRDRAINLQATCDNVEVFNALGVKVAEYQNVDTIDALETAGVYVIRVTINGEVKNCRLVVK